MAGGKPRRRERGPLAQGHTESWGKDGGGVGGKRPQELRALSLPGRGHIRSSLVRFPRGHSTEARTPGLCSTADGPSDSEQSVPGCSLLLPHLPHRARPWPPRRAFLPSAQPISLVRCPVRCRQRSGGGAHPHPPQAPEKANRATAQLSQTPLTSQNRNEPGGRGARGQALPRQLARPHPAPASPSPSPHSPAPGSGPAGRAGPGRAAGTCSSGGP